MESFGSIGRRTKALAWHAKPTAFAQNLSAATACPGTFQRTMWMMWMRTHIGKQTLGYPLVN